MERHRLSIRGRRTGATYWWRMPSTRAVPVEGSTSYRPRPERAWHGARRCPLRRMLHRVATHSGRADLEGADGLSADDPPQLAERGPEARLVAGHTFTTACHGRWACVEQHILL